MPAFVIPHDRRVAEYLDVEIEMEEQQWLAAERVALESKSRLLELRFDRNRVDHDDAIYGKWRMKCLGSVSPVQPESVGVAMKNVCEILSGKIDSLASDLRGRMGDLKGEFTATRKQFQNIETKFNTLTICRDEPCAAPLQVETPGPPPVLPQDMKPRQKPEPEGMRAAPPPPPQRAAPPPLPKTPEVVDMLPRMPSYSSFGGYYVAHFIKLSSSALVPLYARFTRMPLKPPPLKQTDTPGPIPVPPPTMKSRPKPEPEDMKAPLPPLTQKAAPPHLPEAPEAEKPGPPPVPPQAMEPRPKPESADMMAAAPPLPEALKGCWGDVLEVLSGLQGHQNVKYDRISYIADGSKAHITLRDGRAALVELQKLCSGDVWWRNRWFIKCDFVLRWIPDNDMLEVMVWRWVN